MKVIDLQIEGFTPQEIARVCAILEALLQSGGLFGVKSGQTIIHFDKYGSFMGIELNYWPWRNRNI